MSNDSQSQKDRQAKIEAARIDFLRTLRRTFESPDGLRTLEWLRTAAGCGRPAFQFDPGGSVCPYAAAFRDGRKSILDEINANLDEARASSNPTGDTGSKKPKAVS